MRKSTSKTWTKLWFICTLHIIRSLYCNILYSIIEILAWFELFRLNSSYHISWEALYFLVLDWYNLFLTSANVIFRPFLMNDWSLKIRINMSGTDIVFQLLICALCIKWTGPYCIFFLFLVSLHKSAKFTLQGPLCKINL